MIVIFYSVQTFNASFGEEGAFDEPIKGVGAIVHIASPTLNVEDPQGKEYSAQLSDRFVLTSSTYRFLDF